MHSLQIIHRDLKPNNMLAALGADGSYNAVISDLGSSIKLSCRPGEIATGTFISDAAAVGTYQYRAPELFMVSRAFGYPSDVWALGVSIVHMDLAKMPFGRERMQASEISKVFYEALNAISGWTPPPL